MLSSLMSIDRKLQMAILQSSANGTQEQKKADAISTAFSACFNGFADDSNLEVRRHVDRRTSKDLFLGAVRDVGQHISNLRFECISIILLRYKGSKDDVCVQLEALVTNMAEAVSGSHASSKLTDYGNCVYSLDIQDRPKLAVFITDDTALSRTEKGSEQEFAYFKLGFKYIHDESVDLFRVHMRHLAQAKTWPCIMLYFEKLLGGLPDGRDDYLYKVTRGITVPTERIEAKVSMVGNETITSIQMVPVYGGNVCFTHGCNGMTAPPGFWTDALGCYLPEVSTIDQSDDELLELWENTAFTIENYMDGEPQIKHMFISRNGVQRQYVICVIRARSTEYAVVCYNII